MHVIKDLRSYILEDEFELRLFNHKINVVNYTSIGHFDSNKVIIKYSEGEIVVKGENLSVTKLVHDEILIVGKFLNIEFR